MMIPIIYLNGRQDLVKAEYLDQLIDNKEIRRFKRRSGWVDLKNGPLRENRPGAYFGLERRGSKGLAFG